MKHAFKMAFTSVLAISALLTACGKSGGGTTASTPTSGNNSTASCTYDSSGNCTLQVGPAGYVGDGQWSNIQTNQLNVNNTAIMQQLAADNGICSNNTGFNNYGPQFAGYNGMAYNSMNCGSLFSQIRLQVRLNTGGCLPGTGHFSMAFFGQNGMSQPLRAQAQGYQNTSSNGFFLNYVSGSANGAFAGSNQFAYNGGSNLTVGANSMQIAMQPTDNTHTTMNVQIYYRGQQFASGQISGTATFNQGAANSGTQFCGGSGQQNNSNQNGFGGFNNSQGLYNAGFQGNASFGAGFSYRQNLGGARY